MLPERNSQKSGEREGGVELAIIFSKIRKVGLFLFYSQIFKKFPSTFFNEIKQNLEKKTKKKRKLYLKKGPQYLYLSE